MVHVIFSNFDETNERAEQAARFLSLKRNTLNCDNVFKSDSNGGIKIVKISDLSKYEGKELVCADLSRKPLTETASCSLDAARPTGVYVQDSITTDQFDVINHAFTALGDKFGHTGKIEDVFEIFEEFEPGQKNVIFSDDAVKFVPASSSVSPVDDSTFKKLMCKK